MGRKLSPFEAADFGGVSSQDVEREALDATSKSENLQNRIAAALEIPVNVLAQPKHPVENEHEATRQLWLASTVMSTDCSILLQAFTSIEDSEERQRLIKIVQKAAERR